MKIRKPLKENYPITLAFGKHAFPFYIKSSHRGIDYGCPEGTPVYAVADGEWHQVNKSGGEYGNHIILKHKDGFMSLYAHLREFNYKPGWKTVKAGDLIGKSGKTGFWQGRTYGPHLHFELRHNGAQIDPQPYIDAGQKLVDWARSRALMQTSDGSIKFLIKGGVVDINQINCWDIISKNTWGISDADLKILMDLL